MTNPSDPELAALLRETRTVALVGASNNPERAAHGIMKQLLRAGYEVIPVNPKESEVLGKRAYASVDDVPGPIDVVDVFVLADAVVPIAEAAVRKHAKALWLQLGIVNEDAARIAKAAGLTVVMDACMGATHARLHIPPK
jgi:predicted CoA-binding protein